MLNQCQHECRNSLGSYRCVCPPGYRLLPDGKTCHGQRGVMPLPWLASLCPSGCEPRPHSALGIIPLGLQAWGLLSHCHSG